MVKYMSIEEANITIQKAVELYGYEEVMKALTKESNINQIITFKE